MPARPGKVPYRCPHCGFVQNEPPRLISTYCRGCGSHYSIADAAPSGDERPSQAPTLVERAIKKAVARPPIEIFCYHCGHSHDVSGHAKSTICPTCASFIELKDLVVDTPISKPVNIRGHLHVTAKGAIQNANTVCGSALIEGKISGNLYAEEEIRLTNRGRCFSTIAARRIVVERGADLSLTHPLIAAEIIIRGHVTAPIYCSGPVRIQKHGSLEGDIQARSFEAGKGGYYHGSMTIRKLEIPRAAEGTQTGWLPSLISGRGLFLPFASFLPTN